MPSISASGNVEFGAWVIAILVLLGLLEAMPEAGGWLLLGVTVALAYRLKQKGMV